MNKLLLIPIPIIIMLLSGCTPRTQHVTYKNSSADITRHSDTTNAYNTYQDPKAYKHPTTRSYVVRGIRYYPHDTKVGAIYKGNASWYGDKFHGKATSNGEKYNMYARTAAHKTLPMNTMLKVTNLRNGLTTVVRINDRGPFIATRIIDLSNTAAKEIKMTGAGTAPVKVEVLGFYSKNKASRVYKKEKTVVKTPQKPKVKIIPTQMPSMVETENKNIKYSLQIASFSNIEGALSIQEKYNNTDGYTTVIKDIENDSGRYFKVYLRGFKNEQEIRAYKSNSEFQNSFIIKED